MQETVGKMINFAVSSFPKQSLDEWILDYPQQVILTTIHLILTHEINELFEDSKKIKEEKRRREDIALARGEATPTKGSRNENDDDEEDEPSKLSNANTFRNTKDS
jgi:hypothetical protein